VELNWGVEEVLENRLALVFFWVLRVELVVAPLANIALAFLDVLECCEILDRAFF